MTSRDHCRKLQSFTYHFRPSESMETYKHYYKTSIDQQKLLETSRDYWKPAETSGDYRR